MYALMAIPNFIAPLLLSPVLFRIACEYWNEMDAAKKARREEKRKRRHNACQLIHLHTFFPDIYSAPASQTGRYPYRYAAGRFHRMPCRKKTGRKTAFIPKRTTIPCRTPLPLPGTGKNFRHDTHPEKPSEIHERTKISAKRPDNRGIPFAGRIGPHHRCPPGMNRIPSVTTRISRSAGEQPETGTLWRSCW